MSRPTRQAQANDGHGKNIPLASPTDVDGDEVHRFGQSDVHGVGSLHDDDARIVAEFPVQHAIAGVNREDFGSAALKQAIGETAGAAAKIGANFSSDGDGESGEGVIEFCSGTDTNGDIRYIVIGHRSFVICDGEMSWRCDSWGNRV